MAVLVTGGAGYIGSHTVAGLLERGEDVVIVDSLETGHAGAVRGGTFYKGDIRDRSWLEGVFREQRIDTVIHFAAYSLVGESMANPAKYYDNNVQGTLVLLETMQRNGVKRIVFSSTAAVYGEPERTPIRESDRLDPTSVYGETKLTIERMMRWFQTSHGMEYVSLRYFNAAGAHVSGQIGEDHRPETHLIPIVLQAALGQRSEVAIFGDDYATPDGTCIRDYIHVSDLCNAHLLAIDYLRNGGSSDVFNLCNGQGFSVLEVIRTVEQVTGRAIPTAIHERRAGDPAVLIASADKARAVLGWVPQHRSLATIIASAWQWHQSQPHGYGSE
ncbi:UDP-glucose 4-epimerase GalE [Paenibacillus sp. 481]|uniref:UDP-glucose 4-epimerase GalE n=1 Tax=Paenibacillus sp. 481 TaxID=2835869 RepID=UPI001E312E18|nr:UDP-glucose 4-epimerase GalE [Paenibacillus sp. 481]UHA75825.1 UDP-glucose 4-epimerase GalE [Paenibacillus sp. 481]